MQRTLERSSLGVNVGFQSFTDLDYADDVALLAELLYILTHGLGSWVSEEASLMGLHVNWAKNQNWRHLLSSTVSTDGYGLLKP